jgi:hypothetical protein
MLSAFKLFKNIYYLSLNIYFITFVKINLNRDHPFIRINFLIPLKRF